MAKPQDRLDWRRLAPPVLGIFVPAPLAKSAQWLGVCRVDVCALGWGKIMRGSSGRGIRLLTVCSFLCEAAHGRGRGERTQRMDFLGVDLFQFRLLVL